MPLSEHEQRLLDQIERALYAEDPKFATTVRQTDLRTHMRRRLRRAAVVFAVGFVLLVAGVPTKSLAVGVAGFAVMLLSLLLALAAWKRLGSPASARRGGAESGRAASQAGWSRCAGLRPLHRAAPARPRRARPLPQEGWRHRLEQRWNRRWEERGGER